MICHQQKSIKYHHSYYWLKSMQGISLIEILIATALMLFTLVSTTKIHSYLYKQTSNIERKYIALSIVNNKLELLKSSKVYLKANKEIIDDYILEWQVIDTLINDLILITIKISWQHYDSIYNMQSDKQNKMQCIKISTIF